MNTLSWLIYAVQVVDNVRTLVTIGFFLSITIFVLLGFGMMCSEGQLYTSEETRPFATKWSRRAQIAFVVFAIALVVVPKRTTMILMAGSELGERVLVSDPVQSIANPSLDLLKTWIEHEKKRLLAAPTEDK